MKNPTCFIVLFLVAVCIAVGQPATAQTKDPCIWAGKKRTERYWNYKIEVSCKAGKPTDFRVWTLKDKLIWQVGIRNSLFHGPGTFYRCNGEDCRKTFSFQFKDGRLDGDAVIEREPGHVAAVRYKDGVFDGPFSLKTPQGTLTGAFTDGAMSGLKGPPGMVVADKTRDIMFIPYLNHVRDLYREILEYKFWPQDTKDKTYTRDGFKQNDVVGGYTVIYSAGFRSSQRPVSGNGIETLFEGGRPVKLIKVVNGKQVETATPDNPANWQKIPEPTYDRSFRPNKILAVVGAGYGTPGVANVDFTIMAARFQDIGGGGYGLMLGMHRFSDPYHSINAVFGGVAMYITFYAAMGIRTDNETVAPEISVGLGTIGPMLYLRLAPPGTLGKPLEAGITLKLPLGF